MQLDIKDLWLEQLLSAALISRADGDFSTYCKTSRLGIYMWASRRALEWMMNDDLVSRAACLLVLKRPAMSVFLF